MTEEQAIQLKNFGFYLEENTEYSTYMPEIKSCCNIKVLVTRIDDKTVEYVYKNKNYVKPKVDFLRSSWRVYDGY